MIAKVKSSKFIRQTLTLLSGSILSQLILFLSTPILTRLYSPAEFGAFALFMTIIGLFGGVSSLKFEMAIALPKSERDAKVLLILSTLLTTVFAILTLIALYLFEDSLIEHFPELKSYLYLIPVGVLIVGLFQIFEVYSVREELFFNISTSKLSQAISTVSTQIGFKALSNSGLIYGYLIGYSIGAIILGFKAIKEGAIEFKYFTRRRVILNLKKYDNFPKYHSFSSFINFLSQMAPVILLGYFYSMEVAGFYALTVRLLITPIKLITNSVRSVYYQRASKSIANRECIRDIFLKSTLTLLKIGILPALIFIYLSQDIFRVIFGEEWVVSGVYGEILIFWIFMLFINSPAVATISILHMQKFYLKYEIALLIFRFLAIFLGYIIFISEIYSIILYSIVGFFLNIFLIYRVYSELNYRAKRRAE